MAMRPLTGDRSDAMINRVLYAQCRLTEEEMKARLVTVSLSLGKNQEKVFEFVDNAPCLTVSTAKPVRIVRCALLPADFAVPDCSLTLTLQPTGRILCKQALRLDLQNVLLTDLKPKDPESAPFCVTSPINELVNYFALMLSGEAISVDSIAQLIVRICENYKDRLSERVDLAEEMMERLNNLVQQQFPAMSPKGQLVTTAVYGLLGKDLITLVTPQHLFATHLEKFKGLLHTENSKIVDKALIALARTASQTHVPPPAYWLSLRKAAKITPFYRSCLEANLKETFPKVILGRVTIFCLYKLTPEQLNSARLAFTSQLASLPFTDATTPNPVLDPDIHLYGAILNAQVNKLLGLSYEINLASGQSISMESKQSRGRIMYCDQNPIFVFGLEFDSSWFRKPAGTPIADLWEELRHYIGHLLPKENYRETIPDLLLQFTKKYGTIMKERSTDQVPSLLSLVETIVIRFKIPANDDLLFCVSLIIGAFSPSVASIRHLKLLSRLLDLFTRNINVFLRRFQHEWAFTGLLSIMKVNVLVGNDAWTRVFDTVEVTDWSKPIIAESLAGYTESELNQAAMKLTPRAVGPGFKWRKIVLKKRAEELYEVLQWADLTIQASDCTWSPEKTVGQLNTLLYRKKFSISDLLKAVKQLKSVSERGRKLVAASSFSVVLKEALLLPANAVIESNPLYIELFNDKTNAWLLPGFDIRRFTNNLVAKYNAQFSFSFAYRSLKPAIGSALDYLKVWLDAKKVSSIVTWLSDIDTELISLAEGESILAEEVIDRLGQLVKHPYRYLTIACQYMFRCRALQQCYIELAKKRIVSEAAKKDSFTDSRLLGFLMFVKANHEANDLVETFVKNALPRIAPPSEDSLMEKILQTPVRHAYLKLLFQKYLDNPSNAMVQSVKGVANFMAKMDEGELQIGLVETILDNPHLQLICDILDTATDESPELPRLLACLRKWKEQIDITRYEVKKLRKFIGQLFPEISDIHVFTQLGNEWAGSYKTKMLKEVYLEQKFGELIALWKDFRRQTHSYVFREFVGQTKRTYTGISSLQMSRILTDAESSMRNKLATVLGELRLKPLEEVLQLFSNVKDFDKEQKVLLGFFAPTSVPAMKIPECILLLKDIKEKLRICEVLINCQTLIAYRDPEALKFTREYISQYMVRHLLNVADYYTISSNLSNEMDCKAFSNNEKLVKILAALSDNKTTYVAFISKDNFISEMKKNAATDDFAVDDMTMKEIIGVKHFMDGIVGSKNVVDMQSRMMAMLGNTKHPEHSLFQQIDVLFFTTTQKISQIRNNVNRSKKIIASMMQDSSLTFLEGDVSVALRVEYSQGRTCGYDELVDLKSYCMIHEKTKDTELKQGQGDQTVAEFLRFQECVAKIVRNLELLEDLGAPTPDIYSQSFKVSESSFASLIGLESDLSQQVNSWKSVLTDMLSNPAYYALTFFPGKHLWAIEALLTGGSSAGAAMEGKKWLKLMGKSFSSQAVLQRNKGTPTQRVEALCQAIVSLPPVPALKRCLPVPGLTQTLVYDLSDILLTESKDLCAGLLSIYQSAGQKFPKPHQVLFCQATTRICEVSSFLHHCFHCPKYRIFSLVNIEAMSPLRQTEAKEALERVAGLQRESGGTLAVVVKEREKGVFVEFLKAFEGRKVRQVPESAILSSEESIKTAVQALNSKLFIVSSATSGLGKTTEISKRVVSTRRKLVSFSLTGDQSLEAISQLLSTVTLMSTSDLHIDLGYSENIPAVEEFLTQIILVGAVHTNSLLFAIPDSCTVYIEIANLPGNSLISLMPVLKYPMQIHISGLDLSKLVIQREELRVLNYLKAYQADRTSLVDLISDISDVPVSEAIPLLNSFFLASCLESKITVTFRSIRTFISLLYKMIGNMCQDFVIDHGVVQGLRPIMFASLLISAKEYTTKSSRETHESQRIAISGAVESGEVNYTMSWEHANHDTLIFTNRSLFAVYRDIQKVDPDMRALIHQYFCHKNGVNPSDQPDTTWLVDYTNSSVDLLRLLEENLSRRGTIEAEDYVVTPDNFLKMFHINERVNANVPTVIMGETGCGKTALVKFLAEKVLREKCEAINIHAGTTEGELRSKMESLRPVAANTSHLWVFFDEFNTSSCMGLIAEILSSRKIDGKDLPSNMIFIAACNPYRIQSDSPVQTAGIRRNKTSVDQRKLVHIVKPLPDSILEFVWNFGALTEPDTARYIRAILINEKVSELEMFTPMLCRAHHYFTDKEDVSSVSLRDLRRFTKLYHWFLKSAAMKQDIKPTQYYTANVGRLKLSFESVAIAEKKRAGILAIYLCYAIRIASKAERVEFITAVLDKIFDLADFFKIVQTEENDLIARMDIPIDTAINEAIRENVFAIFTCVYTKIPLIVCGKPGCSKSLATTLVFENCRGKFAVDPYFKELEELIAVPFQGSDSCTSVSISKVFERALTLKKLGEGFFVILFDEIGLAELSRFNPLKVLHKELDANNDISFLGISNWVLDASKMNRVLCLQRPEPDLEELEFTGLSLFRSSLKYDFHYEPHIKALATAYHSIQTSKEIKDFYGLRDFYSLIKQVTRTLPLFDRLAVIPIATAVKRAVQRNFGGMESWAEKMWNSLLEIVPDLNQEEIHNMDVRTLINLNIEDKTSRFLMLISSGDITQYALDKLLGVPTVQMVGSTLQKDREGEAYGLRSISDIVGYLEKGDKCLVLKDLDVIYSSLYDLFNQSYSGAGMNRYVQISLGSSYNPRCTVHESFRLVVLINDSEQLLQMLDAPFLNRFEKHVFGIELLLDDESRATAEKIAMWVKAITEPQGRVPLITPSYIFPTYSQEAVQLLVRSNNDVEKLPEDQLLPIIKKKLIETSPADLLVLAEMMNNPEAIEIKNMWRESHINDYLGCISAIIAAKDAAKVILFVYDTSQTLVLPPALEKQIMKTRLSELTSEEDLSASLTRFTDSRPALLYTIEVDYVRDFQHFAYLKHYLERFYTEKSLKLAGKSLCITVTMQRNIKQQQLINCFDDWLTVSVDSLSGVRWDITDEVMQLPMTEMIRRDLWFKFEKNADEMLLKVLLQFNYRCGLLNSDPELINRHLFLLSENLTKHAPLLSLLKSKVHSVLTLLPSEKSTWKDAVMFDGDCYIASKTIHAAIRFTLEAYFKKGLSHVLYDLECQGATRSFFTDWGEETTGPLLRAIWLRTMESSEVDRLLQVQSLRQSNLVSFDSVLEFPFVLKDFTLLSSLASYELSSHAEWNTAVNTYRKKSVIGELMVAVSAKSRVESLYLRDLIRIKAASLHLPQEYERWMYSLAQALLSHTTIFEQRVFGLFQAFSLLIQTCDVLKSLDQFSPLAPQQVLADVLAGVADGYIGSQYSDRVLLRRLEARLETPVFPALAEMDAPGSPPDLQHSFLQWKSSLSTAIGASLEHVFPSHANIRRVSQGSLGAYLSCVQLLQQLLARSESDGIILRSTEVITFIVELTELFVSTNGPIPKLISLCKSIRPSSYGVYNPYKPSDKTYKKLRKALNFLCQADFEAAVQFKARYYAKWLVHDPFGLQQFAEDLDSELGQRNKLWQYSLTSMQAVLDVCGLKDVEEILKRSAERGKEINLLFNDHLDAVEKTLLMKRGNCFQTLLCDLLADALPVVSLNEASLINYFPLFAFCLEASLSNVDKLRNVKMLMCAAYTGWYLDLYTALLFTSEALTPYSEDTLIKINKILSGKSYPLVPTLRLYCLKLMRQQGLQDADLLPLSSQRPELTWIRSADFIPTAVKNDHVAICPSNSSAFTSVCRLLDQSTAYDTPMAERQQSVQLLINEIRKATDVDAVLSFGLACCFQLMPLHRVSSGFGTYLNALKPAANDRFGFVLSSLIGYFIDNFPVGSKLRVGKDASDQELKRILVLAAYLVTVSAHSKLAGGHTTPFVDPVSQMIASDEVFKGMYLIGAEHNPLYEYLQDFANNYAMYRGTATYQCSEDCQFLYCISDCGRAWVVGKCAYCGRDVGGTHHNLISRPGHRFLSDSEAITLAKQYVSDYLATRQERGLSEFGGIAFEAAARSMRGVSGITYRLLHLLLSTQMHFLWLLDPRKVEAMVKLNRSETCDQYFSTSMQIDQAEIYRMLDSSESEMWVFRLLAQLPEFITADTQLPDSPEARRAIEVRFEEMLVAPFTARREETIKKYKESLSSIRQPSIPFVCEETVGPFDMAECFRIRRKPTIDLMLNTLLIQPESPKLSALSVFLRFQGDFLQVSLLPQVLRLATYLTPMFNHRIARQEARTTPISRIADSDPVFDAILTEFLSVWDGITDLQYECHQLDPVHLSRDSELAYFLPDNKELGGGMYILAAVEVLANKQNRLITYLAELVAARNGVLRELVTDMTVYPVETAAERGLIRNRIEDFKTERVPYLNNPAYGVGQEVCFDFDALQASLLQGFKEAKLLAPASLPLIQYQFELLSLRGADSSLIASLRKSIPQQPLSGLVAQRWRAFLSTKAKENPLQFGHLLKELLGAMEDLMCLLKSAKINPGEQIGVVCERMGVRGIVETMQKCQEVGVFEVSNLIAVYEDLETHYFPYMKEYIGAQFKCRDETMTIERILSGLLDSSMLPENGLPESESLQVALMRFISRCLIAEVNAEHSLAMYIARDDFWREGEDMNRVESLQYKLEDVPLKFSLHAYELVDAFNAKTLNSRIS